VLTKLAEEGFGLSLEFVRAFPHLSNHSLVSQGLQSVVDVTALLVHAQKAFGPIQEAGLLLNEGLFLLNLFLVLY